ncbi:WbqC family protein [Roseobacter sp. EG26]|uniref:WbqC family protein n=1 Tax=Roseobacter sp. EG26 TaxID=3412477 RepID=UPI003CE581F6
MQPYFFPYAGYFRLFERTETFVIYDCVQFPRRGWVHRNKLPDHNGNEMWLTLPLQKAARNVRIADLEFSSDARQDMHERLRKFPLESIDPDLRRDILARLERVNGPVIDYLSNMLECVVKQLELPWNVIRSSSLDVPETYQGQHRILEILRRLNGKHYVNSPGGIDLYDPELFAAHGIELEILPKYVGPYDSMLSRLLLEQGAALRQEIKSDGVLLAQGAG